MELKVSSEAFTCLLYTSMDVPGPAADSHDQPYAEFLFHAGADAAGQLFHMAVGRTLNQKNLPACITKHQTSRAC